MNKQLELMFDLLQKEVEQLTAEFTREDSCDSDNKKLDTISETSPLEIDMNALIIESELERSPKNENSPSSITSPDNINLSSQPLTISSNYHQRSASHIEAPNPNVMSPMSHQKSISVDSYRVESDSQDSIRSPQSETKSLNIPSPTQLSPNNYQRIRTLSNSSNKADVAPILSTTFFPRPIPNTTFLSSDDSDSDVSVSSSDDTSSESDSDEDPLMGKLLQNKSSKSFFDVQNSSINEQISPISKENNSKPSSTGSKLSSDLQKSIKGNPTSGRDLHKPSISSLSETLYDTDDEDRPLRSGTNSKVQDTSLINQGGEKQTRTHTNSGAQESKYVNETSISNSYTNDIDDENLPLGPRTNSRTQDINSDKRTVRLRANSRVQKPNLDLNKESSSKNRDLNEQTRRRSISKDMETLESLSDKLRGFERVVVRSRSASDVHQIHSQDHEVDLGGTAKSRDREQVEQSQNIDSQKISEKGKSRINDWIEAVKTSSKTTEPEDKEQIETNNKEIETFPEKERINIRENLEGRGRESNKNIEQDNDRGRTRSKVRGEEERGRARSKVRAEEDRGRARSKVREEDYGRARSKVRGEEDRGRSKSKVRGEEDRVRSKSKVRGEEERERVKSKPKEEERGRTRSRTNEENSGRAKSKTRENDNRERGRSRTRELLEKEKHSRYRREKTEAQAEKEEQKITEINLTTQIFIENVRQYRTLSITSTRTALDVLNYFRNNKIISDSESWTLFELINEYGLERPIRDWEYVATVIGNWELNKQNALVLKKYPNRSCLTLKGFNNAVPPMFGYLHLEIKKNKWQKRHFYIKDGAVYHCKDAKGSNETFLCSLAIFDVYTLTKPVKKSPTKFIFALKSQEKIAMYENPDDYVRFLCADHLDKMKDWVLSLRAAKNILLRAEYPERFISISNNDKSLSENPHNEANNKVLEKRRSNSQWENLRRHVRKSRSLNDKFGDNNFLELISNSGIIKKEPSGGIKESSNNITATNGDQSFKEGSLLDIGEKNLPSKQVEPEVAQFMKGSLLDSSDALFEEAKEREKLRKAMGGVGLIRDPNSSTLVNLNNSVKFNQGSLLDRNNDITVGNNNSNNSSTGHLVQLDKGVQFNKGSLLTKKNTTARLHKSPSETLLKIDPSLSKNATVQNISSPIGKTLLEFD